MNSRLSNLGASALLALGAAFGVQAATITVACGGTGPDFEFCKRHAEQWAQKTGNTVKMFSQPSSTTDSLALYRQLFAAKSSDIDVIMVDIVWPGCPMTSCSSRWRRTGSSPTSRRCGKEPAPVSTTRTG